ncbi:MAG TPA: hypothetical protein VGF46_12440 [Gaiellales bacterium]
MPAEMPRGAGSLAANVVAEAATLIVALAREAGDGATAAQAARIGARAGVLSLTNDVAFGAALAHLRATAGGRGDGFLLTRSLGEAAALPGVICETAADLALLAAALAERGDSSRRADFAGIAELAAAASRAAALLVRSNLTVSGDDARLVSATAAAAEASAAAHRAAIAEG